jgi:hypothetical protein
MTYFSETTCRLEMASDPDDDDNDLKFHDSVVGTPLCGVPVRPWHGHEMILRERGGREVDCGNCIPIHAGQTRVAYAGT